MELTQKEKAVMISLRDNHYGDEGDCVYSWAVNQSTSPSGIEGKELSGVVGSLVKKGLYRVDDGVGMDSCLCITDAGEEVMATL